MIGNNIAVIDLGTNSFHLLIAKVEKYGFEELVKKKAFVQLASSGIDEISAEAFQRGIDVIASYKKEMDAYNVSDFKVFGTAGLRKAKNSLVFRDKVKELFGLNVEVIDGDREAELIYRGVKTAVDLSDTKRLIMDIGGGSTEFIIANNQEIFWKKSFPLGARVLANQFHHSDPISNDEYQNLVNHLKVELKELWDQIELHQPAGLVGASGSFRSLVNLQRGVTQVFPNLESKSDLVNLSGYQVAHLTMLRSSLAERLTIMEIEPERAPLMPVATTLMSIVINHLKPTRSIVVSHHALKEGMLWEMRDKYFAE